MLRERVEDFIAKRRDPAELHMLLNECVADGTVEGLACVRRLYESSYGGTMFNFELKHPAASTLVFWGEAGIQALVDGASADRKPARGSAVSAAAGCGCDGGGGALGKGMPGDDGQKQSDA